MKSEAISWATQLSLITIGRDRLMLKQFEEALDASNDALELANANRYRGHQANALKLAGDAHAGLRNIETALENYDLALAAYRRMDNATGEMETLTAKAELLANADDNSLAYEKIQGGNSHRRKHTSRYR